MIANFTVLQASNNSGQKTISVTAWEDSQGGSESITFDILGEIHTVSVNLPANAVQPVTISNYTTSGTGWVKVTAANTQQTIKQWLTV